MSPTSWGTRYAVQHSLITEILQTKNKSHNLSPSFKSEMCIHATSLRTNLFTTVFCLPVQPLQHLKPENSGKASNMDSPSKIHN